MRNFRERKILSSYSCIVIYLIWWRHSLSGESDWTGWQELIVDYQRHRKVFGFGAFSSFTSSEIRLSLSCEDKEGLKWILWPSLWKGKSPKCLVSNLGGKGMVKESDFGDLTGFSNPSGTYSRAVSPTPSKQIENVIVGMFKQSAVSFLSWVNLNSFKSLSLTTPLPYSNVSSSEKGNTKKLSPHLIKSTF